MRALFLALLPVLAACGGAARHATAPVAPGPPIATATLLSDALGPPVAAPTPLAKSAGAVPPSSDDTRRAKVAAEAKPSAPQPHEAQGKLLKRPSKSTLIVSMEADAPAVGEKAELLRRVAASVPVVGGSWLVVADTEVTATSGNKVTLHVVAEKAKMTVNGKKLNHFTPGVPIVLKWSDGAAGAGN